MQIKTDEMKEARPIPAGVYETKAVSCHIVGKDASLELRITEGKFKGRKVFYWIRGNFLAKVDVVKHTTPDTITFFSNKVAGITSEVTTKEAHDDKK